MTNLKKVLVGSTIAGSLLMVGAVGLVTAGAASASPVSASTSSSSTTPSTTPPDGTHAGPHAGPHDESLGGHVGKDGTVEVLLTGSTADSVKAAAIAANPGATVMRVENDAEGATYEAHIIKADGTRATVKLDASFTVTSTDTNAGHGAGPHAGPGAGAPADASTK